MNERSVASALAMIGHGFMMLSRAIDAEGAQDMLQALVDVAVDKAEPSLHKAMKDQKMVNAARAGAPEPEAVPIRRSLTTKPKPEPEAEPDEQEDHTADDAQARLNALSDDDLDEMGRNDLKELAEALGFDTQGKKGDDLRSMLKAKRVSKKGASPAAKAAGKKAKSDEPDLDTMREELTIFFKANKSVIEESYEDFFEEPGRKEKYNADAPKAALILADDDLTASEWRDNVPDAKANGEWEAMVEAAEAEVD